VDVVTVVVPERVRGNYPDAGVAGVRYLRADNDRLPELVGDEGAMVARRLPDIPLLFCRNKSNALAAAAAFGPTHAVLDDAFQSWGVPRHVDVVLVDGTNPFDDGWSLPAGRLREPPEALERADVIGVGGVEDEQSLSRALDLIADKAGVTRPSFGVRRRFHLDNTGGEPVATLSGVGRPDTFERQVADAGARLEAAFRFPDHHRYSPNDVEWIVGEANSRGIETVVTTEKDWVKLRALGPPEGVFVVARLALEFFGGDPIDLIKKAAE
jgi:tetraacyldisaccharide 4'-kinase